MCCDETGEDIAQAARGEGGELGGLAGFDRVGGEDWVEGFGLGCAGCGLSGVGAQSEFAFILQAIERYRAGFDLGKY